MSESKILVIGSSNTDMVICTGHLPLPGETVIGGTFFMNPGGKGANQAVTVARLGGRVSFICKTGSDIFGHQANQLFNEEGIDTSYVFSDTKNPSGVALITVDTDAENCIVVAPEPTHISPRTTSNGRPRRSKRPISSCCNSKSRCKPWKPQPPWHTGWARRSS